jgi:hypothetical protein
VPTNVHTYEVKWTRADGSERTSNVQAVHGLDTERMIAERLVKEPRSLGDVLVVDGVPSIHSVTKLDPAAAERAKATRPKLPAGLEKHIASAEAGKAKGPPPPPPAATAPVATATAKAAAPAPGGGRG